MELNREQALEILEKFDMFQGQRAGRELWQDKPFEVQAQDVANFSRDVSLLINYIKELTEENERLKEGAERHLENLKAVLGERSESNIVADTVREMQEMIESRCIEGGIYPAFVKSVVHRVAQELLEESNNEGNN